MKRKLAIFILMLAGNHLIAQLSPFDSTQIISTCNIYFNFGESSITEEAQYSMDTFALKLGQKDYSYISIIAHTDSIGTVQNNLKLATDRASSTQDYLSEKGAPRSKFKTLPLGEGKPLASNQTEEGRQKNRRVEIVAYYFRPMTKLSGQILDDSTKQGIQAKIIFKTKTERDSLMTAEDGTFTKAIAPNTVVGVDVIAKDHFFDSKIMKIGSKPIQKLKIELPNVKVGASIDLNHLYFVGGQPTLLSKSIPQLNILTTFMRLNTDVSIEIAGHINQPFTAPDKITGQQFQLSVNRAKVVYDHLIKKKVNPARLKFKGYGNRFMKYPEAKSQEHQAANRRVEIKILGTNKVISEALK